MSPRNSRTDRHSRSAGRSSKAPRRRSARDSVSGNQSRNELGRYSRYASKRPYAHDSNVGQIRRVGTPAGGSGTGQYSRSSAAYSHASAKKKGRGRKVAIAVVAALVVVLVGCGTAMAFYINGINSTLRGDLSDDQMAAIDSQLVNTDLSKPFYMLLMGSDIRDGQSQAESRSDTNILVRVDAEHNQVTMLSILRDTAIELDGHGIVKFNAAYSYDGAAGIIREASQLCGVEISHYAEVNFANLEALVDAVGGVDIDVQERIDDPDADNTSWDPNARRVILEKGMQHLDGWEALVFARSRAFVDGDYTRTAHQRQLVEAIANKVLSLPVPELPGGIEAAAQCVTTDLSVTDIINLAQMFADDDGDMTIYSAVMPSTAEYVTGISYVFADTDELTEMMEVIDEGGDPSTLDETASASSSSSSGSNSSDTASSSSRSSGSSSSSSSSSG